MEHGARARTRSMNVQIQKNDFDSRLSWLSRAALTKRGMDTATLHVAVFSDEGVCKSGAGGHRRAQGARARALGERVNSSSDPDDRMRRDDAERGSQP